eukprot:TRINITY_DN357_c0_g1_i12.p1 TRINITY_DN357_c0_g1~~TRINITY_DN357_c0_g1_i12.p1  ORF type:complete len:249 (+),score=-14.59 TRINITY_DN357_c0_g1_i12:172-918(+)
MLNPYKQFNLNQNHEHLFHPHNKQSTLIIRSWYQKTTIFSNLKLLLLLLNDTKQEQQHKSFFMLTFLKTIAMFLIIRARLINVILVSSLPMNKIVILQIRNYRCKYFDVRKYISSEPIQTIQLETIIEEQHRSSFIFNPAKTMEQFPLSNRIYNNAVYILQLFISKAKARILLKFNIKKCNNQFIAYKPIQAIQLRLKSMNIFFTLTINNLEILNPYKQFNLNQNQRTSFSPSQQIILECQTHISNSI